MLYLTKHWGHFVVYLKKADQYMRANEILPSLRVANVVS